MGAKQGRQCDFEEETLCGAVNQGATDNFNWQWVNGSTAGKMLMCCSYLFTFDILCISKIINVTVGSLVTFHSSSYYLIHFVDSMIVFSPT